jgi:hypothetical protein
MRIRKVNFFVLTQPKNHPYKVKMIPILVDPNQQSDDIRVTDPGTPMSPWGSLLIA